MRNVCVCGYLRTFPIVCVFIIYSRSIHFLIKPNILRCLWRLSWTTTTTTTAATITTTIQSTFNDNFSASLLLSRKKAMLNERNKWCRSKRNEWIFRRTFVFVSIRTHGYNNTNEPNRHISEPSPSTHNGIRASKISSLSWSLVFFLLLHSSFVMRGRLKRTHSSTTIQSWCIYLNCFWSLSVCFWHLQNRTYSLCFFFVFILLTAKQLFNYYIRFIYSYNFVQAISGSLINYFRNFLRQRQKEETKRIYICTHNPYHLCGFSLLIFIPALRIINSLKKKRLSQRNMIELAKRTDAFFFN